MMGRILMKTRQLALERLGDRNLMAADLMGGYVGFDAGGDAFGGDPLDCGFSFPEYCLTEPASSVDVAFNDIYEW